MKAFLFGILTAALVTLASVLWAFNSDVSVLKEWKKDHVSEDNTMFEIIRSRLDRIDDKLNKIHHYLMEK